MTTTTIVNSPKFLNHPNHVVANHKIDEFIVNSEKPPAHPNTYLLSGGGSSSSGSSSYSLIGQKRRELLQQRNKLNSGGSSSCSSSAGTASISGSSGLNDRLYLNSPKATNGINIKIDVTPSLPQHYAASNNTPNSNSTNNNNNNNPTVLPLNRIALTSPSPLQSPNTFFPMPISNSSQSSSSFSNSNNSNNNFTNLKYIEGNYRDYQLAKNKEQHQQQQQQQSNKNTPSNDSIRLNNNTVIDMNLYKKLDISNYLDQQHQLNQMINRELYANTKPVENQQANITRIPLSPKSNLRPNNYYHPNGENLQNNKPVFNNTSAPDQIILRRPAATTDTTNGNNQMSFTSKPPTPPNTNHTPNATVTQLLSPHPIVTNNTNNNVPKTNIRFAYINSPLSSHNPNNQINYYNDSQIKAGNSSSSAENVTNGKGPNSAPIHLEIKYPLYSNHQTQNTQFINITKPINKQPSFESDPSQSRMLKIILIRSY